MKIYAKILMGFVCLSLGMGSFLPSTIYAEEENETQQEEQNFSYVHDPRFDSKAMEDIVVDETAVYGFRPSEDSTRLSEYADYDWSDPIKVEQWKQERIAYFESYDEMYQLWHEMESEGKTIEEIAKAVSHQRNVIRLNSYADDPEGLEKVKASNLATYGNEEGPTAESLFEKYGSWEMVLKKAFSSNSGMDACLGLYDDRYEYNVELGAAQTSDEILYVVKQYDNLSKIAKKYYGNQDYWTLIYYENQDSIQNPNLIFINQVFRIPENK